jgi:hypothetical protein
MVNWTNAPAYKLAKILVKKLAIYIPLPYIFNIKKPTDLIAALKDISVDPDLKFASFDITNMYSNIPTTDLIHIAQDCDQQCLHHNIKQEIVSLSNTVTEQNYFCYQGTTYIQTKGLAMGAPTSSLFSEIYLYHLEITQIVDILLQYRTVGYFQHINDILVVYKQNLTNIQEVLTKFNNLTPKFNFTLEEETNKSISFLDVTITKEDDHLSFKVYRKPTTTDSIIPNDSCYPVQHKLAAITFFN